MTTFTTPPTTCIACELADAGTVVFGKAFGIDKFMEKLCGPHRVAAHAAFGSMDKAIDVEEHRREKTRS